MESKMEQQQKAGTGCALPLADKPSSERREDAQSDSSQLHHTDVKDLQRGTNIPTEKYAQEGQQKRFPGKTQEYEQFQKHQGVPSEEQNKQYISETGKMQQEKDLQSEQKTSSEMQQRSSLEQSQQERTQEGLHSTGKQGTQLSKTQERQSNEPSDVKARSLSDPNYAQQQKQSR